MVRFEKFDSIDLADKETLFRAVNNDIIDMNDVRNKVEMMERTKILEQHKYAITQGQDGNWRTYLPDTTKKNNRRQVKKSTKEKVEQTVVEYYSQLQKKESVTLESL